MDNKNCAISSNTDSKNNTKQASNSTEDLRTRARVNMKIVQNVMLIWLDKKIDDNNEDCHKTVTQLRYVGNSVHTFTDSDQCIDFITDSYNEDVVLIISGALCQNIVPLIHDIAQLHNIFIFTKNKIRYEQWTKKWSKIKDVFTEVTPICQALNQVSQQCEQNAISISFVAIDGNTLNKNLDRLDPMFMYSQILKEILLTIKFEQQHIDEFLNYCRDMFDDNERVVENVDQLKRTYHNRTPIWWYTYQGFLFTMLNRALRTTDVDIMIKMGFFIGDLHRDIEKLHKEQFDGHLTSKTFTVYRGQGLSSTDFDQLMKTKGGLLSFNNFLSTSKDRDVSLAFAESNQYNTDSVGILFVMTIDSSQSTTPFASINGVSYFQTEDEVLFSMHTIFRIDKIESMDETHRLFQVDLTLTGEDDKDLRVLTDHIREETYPESRGWYRLGLVLHKMGQFGKSQQVYEALLDQTTDESAKAPIYGQIALAKSSQGEYDEAITFYNKVVEIYNKTLPPNHLNLSDLYNNIGEVYCMTGDYPKALSSFEKALEINKQSLPSNHPDLASSYNDIGVVYSRIGDYPKALSSHEKALEIQKQSLPPNHPDLASSYGNIGIVYDKMGDYPKALSYYEKAVEIEQQSLPPNHPNLASSYSNIGIVYDNMGDYPKALSYYEKAVEIQKQSLPPNHPNLASSYGNIGIVYREMGDYPKALLYYEKALEIRKQSLPANHPDLASSYDKIGLLYGNMGDCPKALSYYEKAVEIEQQSLPPNHPNLASSYGNIGIVYREMGDYSKAISYYEKAVEIQKQSLPPNHRNLASSYGNIGIVYREMGDYSKALSYYEKAVEIQKQSLPPNHRNLASSYGNIGIVYREMGDYLKALLYYEKALEIRKQSLPRNHPDLASSYGNIGNLYGNMGDYPKALSYYERGLEIKQQSFPPNYPDLAKFYNIIGLLHENMGNYSKARSCMERAVNIGQQSLPPNHPHLQRYRNILDRIKKKL
jgi:tetratricopeptide (TPR) repeat protein